MRSIVTAVATALCIATAQQALAEENVLDTFEHKQLTDVYYSEGANAGDINGDGHDDVVYGPFWFAGPDFTEKHEIYPAKPQNVNAYADNFFSWIYDFDGDKRNDVFTVGFPGKPAYVYQNPGPDGWDKPWPKHQVFDSVSNESPQFVDLVKGDDRPELVCTRDGFFGYASINSSDPLGTWEFTAISAPDAAPKSFGHGLGVGDVNGDSRLDIISLDGWHEQPDRKFSTGRWDFHPVQFAKRGGAEMYAYDVDGDGDNDVITSLAAHDFGLAWHEQLKTDKGIEFKEHLIMGSRPEENHYGLVFSEPHSVALADIDGDGLKDIITGKTYWSHHKQSPMWDAGAVVYWFRLVRGADGSVDWVPYLAAADSGIGRQISIRDVNADKLPDIVVGGMKGASVLLHQRKEVSAEEYKAAQPKPYDGATTMLKRGPHAPIDAASRQVAGALEGESLKVLGATAGKTQRQNMAGFGGDAWSGDAQLFWTGAKPGAKLELELPVATAGAYSIETVLTMAGDYAVVRLTLDGAPLGEALDCFYDDVVTTGVLELGRHELAAGPHKLGVEIVGASPAAQKAYMFGIDYVRLIPAK